MENMIVIEIESDAGVEGTYIMSVAEFLECNDDLRLEVTEWIDQGMTDSIVFGGGASPIMTICAVEV
jgi:hypothetical protein